MKNKNAKTLGLVIVISIMLNACSLFKYPETVFETCPVCHMSIDRSDALVYKYKDVKYYFDKYECKQVFKMNPEIVIEKNTLEVKK
jgi:YHS domain-containing protein